MDFADFFIGWVIDNQLGMFDQRSQLFGLRKAIAVLLAYEQVFPGELVFSGDDGDFGQTFQGAAVGLLAAHGYHRIEGCTTRHIDHTEPHIDVTHHQRGSLAAQHTVGIGKTQVKFLAAALAQVPRRKAHRIATGRRLCRLFPVHLYNVCPLSFLQKQIVGLLFGRTAYQFGRALASAEHKSNKDKHTAQRTFDNKKSFDRHSVVNLVLNDVFLIFE
jgi:hypothetical protein